MDFNSKLNEIFCLKPLNESINPQDNYYIYLTDDTITASGKINLYDQTINFWISAYGAIYDIIINNTAHPQYLLDHQSGEKRLRYSFPGYFMQAIPQVWVPKSHPAHQLIMKLLDHLDKPTINTPTNPITNDELPDEDKFENQFEDQAYHIHNGIKEQETPELAKQHIEEPPTNHTIPDPTIPGTELPP